jgi:hypothetical protein
VLIKLMKSVLLWLISSTVIANTNAASDAFEVSLS